MICAEAMCQKRGTRAPVFFRRLAVSCFDHRNGNIRWATKDFKARAGNDCVKRPREFVRRWSKAVKQRSNFEEQHRSGRPRKLPDEAARTASQLFAAGFRQVGSGNVCHYSSIAQALALCPGLRDIKREAGVSDYTLIESMKRANPVLQKRRQETTQPMSAALKQRRLRVAKELDKKPRSYFKRIFWIDAAKLWIHVAGNRQVFVDVTSGPPPLLHDPRAPGKRSSKVALAYYAAVNEMLGPVHLELTSGTLGYSGKKLKEAKVLSRSSCHPDFICLSSSIHA